MRCHVSRISRRNERGRPKAAVTRNTHTHTQMQILRQFSIPFFRLKTPQNSASLRKDWIFNTRATTSIFFGLPRTATSTLNANLWLWHHMSTVISNWNQLQDARIALGGWLMAVAGGGTPRHVASGEWAGGEVRRVVVHLTDKRIKYCIVVV